MIVGLPYSVFIRDDLSCNRWEKNTDPQSDIMQREIPSNTQLLVGCFHQFPPFRAHGTPQKMKFLKRIQESEGMENTRRTNPSESTELGSQKQRLKHQ